MSSCLTIRRFLQITWRVILYVWAQWVGSSYLLCPHVLQCKTWGNCKITRHVIWRNLRIVKHCKTWRVILKHEDILNYVLMFYKLCPHVRVILRHLLIMLKYLHVLIFIMSSCFTNYVLMFYKITWRVNLRNLLIVLKYIHVLIFIMSSCFTISIYVEYMLCVWVYMSRISSCPHIYYVLMFYNW